MRERLYNIVHVYEGNKLSVAYKYFMIFVIIVTLVPLMTRDKLPFFKTLEWICLVVFIVDYFLRWITADYKFDNHSWVSFLKYPFRLISIIDLMSSFALFTSCTNMFNEFDIAKVLAVFRIVRIFRYSKNIRTILEILKKSRKPLIAVGNLAIGYIIISAIVIFNIEPESFGSFFDALYWSTISLTTVGYGDIYPVTMAGRIIAMVSSFLGIAIVALPAGVVTAEYLNAIKEKSDG